MKPVYKLDTLDICGHAYIAKCLLALGGTPYTLTSKPFNPESYYSSPKSLSSSPTGDNLVQEIANTRDLNLALAKGLDLYPSDPKDENAANLLINDMLPCIHALHDYCATVSDVSMPPTSPDAHEKRLLLIDLLDKLLASHENIIMNSNSCFYIKNSPSLPDFYMLYIFVMVSHVSAYDPDLDRFSLLFVPHILRLVKLLYSTKAIQSVSL
ncbi:hypothetical protein BB560_003088 [Smittium megazygosporum]|uniref:GST C-terminal domain-containing protein n=1 Tax=Smittium megazygosporum TaxID=133381 RepID=A0A2T9ZD38_9FUNG|nr:hypothetical protein BB560_003088 [Smittium megazygosporum]